MTEVFISYSKSDSEFAEMIYDAVSKLDLQCYAFTKTRNFGSRINNTTLSNIQCCKYFIVILTQNGIRSQWVNQEIGVAYALNKNIIPIFDGNMDISKLGLIQDRKYIRYKVGKQSNERECILDVILELRKKENIDKATIECPYCRYKFKVDLPSINHHKNSANCDRIEKCNNCKCSFSISLDILEPKPLLRGGQPLCGQPLGDRP